ncbi:SdpA family antimicrobial peptide system protein [Streptomyces sp. NPDC002536]
MTSTSTETHPGPTATRTGSARQLLLFVTACLLVFGYLALSLFYTMPTNALSSRHSKGIRPALNILTPENWAFFTRNPEGEQIGIYSYGADGSVHNLLNTPQGSPANLFGLSRTQRAQGPEIGFFSTNATQHWSGCAGYLDDCLREASKKPALKVNNTSPVPTVCGEAYLTRETTVPWSFRNQVSYDRRVEHVAHLDIRCR